MLQFDAEHPDHYLTWMEDLIEILTKMRKQGARPVYVSIKETGEECELKFFKL